MTRPSPAQERVLKAMAEGKRLLRWPATTMSGPIVQIRGVERIAHATFDAIRRAGWITSESMVDCPQGYVITDLGRRVLEKRND